ncbi:alanine/glycine:cation symporter family protein [Arcanobacterium phocae]|uniref:Alanine or glycine:cation symporter, AGCS family n=1 Tax=Arcanobacterium phocae TaxID=131112 RepID=A0A1H2LCZ9_9ACTO|nr:alanine/glycine:cation symporter family protein [Arcanobacterium phocae]SDU78873.1 alanine or glycine:cation symporter, AGCS family [Arcanobacterium phocae]
MNNIWDSLNANFSWFNDVIYTWILIPLLIGAGLYFTVRSKGLQFRLFRKMFKVIGRSREKEKGQISSFQAFAIGLAARVGTGNIAGVAVAITLGGAGAVFWMWVVAILGMATAFIEAALAQLFKVPWRDGTFRGGPAYYIWKGLGSWGWGAAFAVALLFTYGIAFELVQSNTISNTLYDAYNFPTWATGLVVTVLTGLVILGGLKSVARVTEIVAPAMALVYIAISLAVIATHLDHIIPVFTEIFESAFGINEAFAGTAGGFTAALMNGVKRGLYSNEAGMGSAPNAASTATTIHPARQALIQSMGVFVDTMLVCSATAFIILTSGIYVPGQDVEGATLTTSAAVSALGGWLEPVMIILVFVFCFSSLIGNYAYAEVNMDYLFPGKKSADVVLRVIVVAATFIGAIAKLGLVWTLADTSMFFMAVINLVAIILLGKWAFGVLRDFESTDGEGAFVAVENQYLPGEIPDTIWTKETAGQEH